MGLFVDDGVKMCWWFVGDVFWVFRVVVGDVGRVLLYFNGGDGLGWSKSWFYWCGYW